MAKIIVTGFRQYTDGLRAYQILIDGYRVTSIGAGGKVEVPLPPGRHEVRVRTGITGSQPLWIELGPEDILRLQVGLSLRGPWHILLLWPALVMLVETLVTLPGEHWLGAEVVRGWQGVIGPVSLLPTVFVLALVVLWRGQLLYIERVPERDPTAPPTAKSPEIHPPRIRITIGQLMKAVAILAVLLCAGIMWGRRERSGYFRSQASFHAQLEAEFLQREQDDLRRDAQSGNTTLNASLLRRSAARSAARADYHAALKRKYEEAALRGVFTVEPDPPEPPWP